MSDNTEIRKVLEDHAAAIHAKDAAAAMASYAEDVVIYDLPPPLAVEGVANGPATLEAWFATWRGPVTVRLHDPRIAIDGDLALCHGLLHMTGTKTDGERVDLWARQTIALRRAEGRWRIMHEHTSVPFHMDGSLRAAVELKPGNDS